MEVAEVDGLNKRVFYYASKSYTLQIDRGDLYEKLNPTFFIGILNFIATQKPNYISRHKIIHIETTQNLISDIGFNFIELPKFNMEENELIPIIDRWVYFTKSAEDLEKIPENVKEEDLKRAFDDADKHNWIQEEIAGYDKVFIIEQDDS